MRTNYINEIDVRIQGTLISFNNDMPKVEPADVFKKLVPFSLPSNFLSKIKKRIHIIKYQILILKICW